MAVAAGVLAPFAWTSGAAEVAQIAGSRNKDEKGRERYRAVSWWLTWEDLTWPNEALMDKIRRRADR
jgi:hypothetical protein